MEKKKLKLFVCVLAIGLTAGLANADLETGLVGYWAFEDGAGSTTAADTSPGGLYDGTLVGTPEWDSGPPTFGGALLFDVGSSGDGIECGTACAPSAGTGKFTLAIWAYWQDSVTTQQYQHFMTKSDGWDIDLMMWQWELYANATQTAKTDKIGISCGGVGSFHISASTMPVEEWTHLAVTFDGTAVQLFVNGLADPMGPVAFSIGNKLDAEFYIGVNHRYNRSFDGRLDEVRVYNRVLSDEEVMLLVAPDPDYNFTPNVDAGNYQSLLWPDNSVQLDATVSDDGKPADPCAVTLTWSKISGPGDVTFDPCNAVEDPVAIFTAAGMYELQLRGYDGEKDACDVVAIQIRPNDDPIALWDFEEGTGDTVDDESANNNVGDLAGNSEPNWVSGWVGDWAMEFYAVGDATVSSYVDIISDVSAADPNLETLRYDITLSAWFKIGDLAITSSPVIVANGNLGWRLYANHGDGSIVFTPGDGVITDWTKRTTSAKLVDDGYWHHAVGIYDYASSKSYLYIDGVLDAESVDVTGMMAEADDKPVSIGARWDKVDDVLVAKRGWNGRIDDVQVYSYCISEARIAALAGMGDLVPQVNAGEDQTVSLQDGAIQLAGTATDDGKPSPSLDIEWTSDPCNPGTVTFDPCDAAVATATFSEAGEYILSLTAYDGHAEVFDEVTITVVNPTCQDVIDDGFLIVGDVSGPEGTPDCHVGLYDFAVFAGEWLSCNNPTDPDCESPY